MFEFDVAKIRSISKGHSFPFLVVQSVSILLGLLVWRNQFVASDSISLSEDFESWILFLGLLCWTLEKKCETFWFKNWIPKVLVSSFNFWFSCFKWSFSLTEAIYFCSNSLNACSMEGRKRKTQSMRRYIPFFFFVSFTKIESLNFNLGSQRRHILLGVFSHQERKNFLIRSITAASYKTQNEKNIYLVDGKSPLKGKRFGKSGDCCSKRKKQTKPKFECRQTLIVKRFNHLDYKLWKITKKKKVCWCYSAFKQKEIYKRLQPPDFFFCCFGGWMTTLIASSKTAFKPFCVKAEHSMYFRALTSFAFAIPCS